LRPPQDLQPGKSIASWTRVRGENADRAFAMRRSRVRSPRRRARAREARRAARVGGCQRRALSQPGGLGRRAAAGGPRTDLGARL